MNFVGPESDTNECGLCGEPESDEEVGEETWATSEPMLVDEQTFCLWMDSAEFTVGVMSRA